MNRILNEEPEIATTQPPNFPRHAVAENCPLLITPSGPLLQENCWGGGWLSMALLQVEIVVLLMKLAGIQDQVFSSWPMTVTQPQ